MTREGIDVEGLDPEESAEFERGLDRLERYLDTPTLLTVLAVNHIVPATDGGQLVITAVELWSSLIVIHSAQLAADGQAHDAQSAPDRPGDARSHRAGARALRDLQLQDDLGNRYAWLAGTGGGGGDRANLILRHTTTYQGPLSAGAGTLTFRSRPAAGSSPITIPLVLPP